MPHKSVLLHIPHEVEAFETWEDGTGTVLYVVHDLQPGDNEGIYAFRQRLIPFRAPDGRYDKIYIQSKHGPNASWTA
jgi:hypothetical protein